MAYLALFFIVRCRRRAHSTHSTQTQTVEKLSIIHRVWKVLSQHDNLNADLSRPPLFFLLLTQTIFHSFTLSPSRSLSAWRFSSLPLSILFPLLNSFDSHPQRSQIGTFRSNRVMSPTGVVELIKIPLLSPLSLSLPPFALARPSLVVVARFCCGLVDIVCIVHDWCKSNAKIKRENYVVYGPGSGEKFVQ